MFNHFWFKGAVIGLLIPGLSFSILRILTWVPLTVAQHIMLAFLAVAIAFIGLPAVILGDAFKLPIQIGGDNYVFYNLNLFGYLWVLLFWLVAGLSIGVLADHLSITRS